MENMRRGHELFRERSPEDQPQSGEEEFVAAWMTGRGEGLDVAGHCLADGMERPEPSRNLRMAPTRPMIQPTG
jgi:hypothetical protein